MAVRSIFADNVKEIFVSEISVKIDDIFVFESVVDTDFFGDLVLYFFFTDNRFADDFECAQEICMFVAESGKNYIDSQTVPNLPLPSSRSLVKS
jgi:hypothetical protein